MEIRKYLEARVPIHIRQQTVQGMLEQAQREASNYLVGLELMLAEPMAEKPEGVDMSEEEWTQTRDDAKTGHIATYNKKLESLYLAISQLEEKEDALINLAEEARQPNRKERRINEAAIDNRLREDAKIVSIRGAREQTSPE